MDGLKYRIDEYLNKLNPDEYLEAVNTLPELLGISRSQFNRIRKYQRSAEKNSTKVEYLVKIADYFNCTVDDLINKGEAAA